MLPAENDEKVLEMIRNMHNTGAIINFHIIVGLATGVVLANDRILLKENRGTLNLLLDGVEVSSKD